MFLKNDGYNTSNALFFLKWARSGVLIYLASFFWAPSRDALQIVYLFAFFIPIGYVLLSQKPKFLEYGGRMTGTALIYAGFSALSALWGTPEDFGYFIFQWVVLAAWLCGASLLCATYDFDLQKGLLYFIAIGSLTAAASITYYYGFAFGSTSNDIRLWGWNIFRNPNELGAMCGIVALITYIFALKSPTLIRSWVFYSIALIPLTGLVLSLSRGSLFSFVVTAFLALIIIRPPLKIWLPPVAISLIAIMLLVDVNDLNNYYIDGRSARFGGRFEIWSVAFESIKENILFGTGLSKKTGILVPGFDLYNHAHSAWIDTLYRTGIVGLLLLIIHFKTIVEKFHLTPKLMPLYLWLCYGCLYSTLDGRGFFWDMGAKWFFYWIPVGLIIAFQSKNYILRLNNRIQSLTYPDKNSFNSM